MLINGVISQGGMKKLAALVLGAGLLMSSCKEKVSFEPVNHLDVAIYHDTDMKSADIGRIDKIVEKSEHYYASLLEKSPRFKGRKMEMDISIAGKWESDQTTDMLNEFSSEIDGVRDINIGFTGKTTLRGKDNNVYSGLANLVPGRYALVATLASEDEIFVTLNHEIGHLLGLNHSTLQGSLMSANLLGIIVSDTEREVAADTFLSWLSFKDAERESGDKTSFPKSFEDAEFERPRLYLTYLKKGPDKMEVFLSGAGSIGVEAYHDEREGPSTRLLSLLSKDLRSFIGERMFLSYEAPINHVGGNDSFYSLVLISPDAVEREGVAISRLLERYGFFTLEQRSDFIAKIADSRIADKKLFESFWEE